MTTPQAGTPQNHAHVMDDKTAPHEDFSYTLRTKDGKWQLIVDLPSMEAAANAIKNISRENNDAVVNVAVYDHKAKRYVDRSQMVLKMNMPNTNTSDDFVGVSNNNNDFFSAINFMTRAAKISVTSILLMFIIFIVFLAIHIMGGPNVNKTNDIAQATQRPTLDKPSTSNPSEKPSSQTEKRSATLLVGVDTLIQRIPEICDINFDIVNTYKLDLASSTIKLDVKSASGRTMDTGDASTDFVNAGSSSTFSKMFRVRCADVASITARSTSNRYIDDNSSFGYSTIDSLQVEQLSSSKIPILVPR